LTVVLDTPGDSLPARRSDYHASQRKSKGMSDTPRCATFRLISLWPGNALEWRGFRLELIEGDGVVEKKEKTAKPGAKKETGKVGPARALAVHSLSTMVKAASKQ
jgi:hypothetical protein